LGTIDIIRDVTKQYADNAALATAKDLAEYANKAKSQFLANMSHEIRTPINAIQGMYYLLENTSLSNQQRQHLENAQSASIALLHLVDELLDLSKIESGKLSIFKQSCNLDKIVSQAVKLNIGLASQKALNIKINIDREVPTQIISDELRLVQVLSNLINNAVKFTHQGEVSLAISVINPSEESLDKGQKTVRFIVKDTGIGIEKSKQQRLFGAFIQADESMTREYGGSGLGLSICQKIIRLLGGEIVLSSDAGEGAEFSFELNFDLDKEETLMPQQLHFCTFGETLPKKLLDEILALGYEYENLAEFNLLATEQPNKKVVLFVEMKQLNEYFCENLIAKFPQIKSDNNSVIHLVLYEKDLKSKNANGVQLLNEQNISYAICEPPFYRYCITSLLTSIWTASQNKESKGRGKLDNTSQDNPLAGLRILLVEDNLVNQLVAKELLNSVQIDVVIAENGQEAIDKLALQTFDVVLMDIQMPVMDGLTATKLLRADNQFNDLPIIAMTAHARQEDKEKSIEAGMNLHVAKPVKAEILFSSIAEVLKC